MSGAALVQYTASARADLKKLDKRVAARIIAKIRENASLPNPLERANTLQGNFGGQYRYRVGDYRAIFIVSDGGTITVLTILAVKHRKDVYR